MELLHPPKEFNWYKDEKTNSLVYTLFVEMCKIAKVDLNPLNLEEDYYDKYEISSSQEFEFLDKAEVFLCKQFGKNGKKAKEFLFSFWGRYGLRSENSEEVIFELDDDF